MLTIELVLAVASVVTAFAGSVPVFLARNEWPLKRVKSLIECREAAHELPQTRHLHDAIFLRAYKDAFLVDMTGLGVILAQTASMYLVVFGGVLVPFGFIMSGNNTFLRSVGVVMIVVGGLGLWFVHELRRQPEVELAHALRRNAEALLEREWQDLKAALPAHVQEPKH